MTDDKTIKVYMSCKEPFPSGSLEPNYSCLGIYGEGCSEHLKLSLQDAKKSIANVPCLTGLRMILDYGYPDDYGCSDNSLTLRFDSVNLDCDPEMHDLHSNLKRTAHEQIELCLERMRKSKCRYASFAQIFFPNAYTKGK